MGENTFKERRQVVLAALLHDIGKFWQRGDDYLNQSKNIKGSSDNWGWLVPTNPKSGNPAYQHAIWTYQFLEDRKSAFDKIGAWNLEEKFSELSAKHHRPDTPLQALIQMADWWSSGIDRNAVQSEEGAEKIYAIDWGAFAFKKIPLHSIFDKLKVNKTEGSALHAYRLCALDINSEEAVLPYSLSGPGLEKLKADGLNGDYKKLWNDFAREFGRLPVGNSEAFSTSLLYLLKKYTWCIPSSTVDMPDVSLFEHLKTTAAIAGCLHDFWQEQPTAFRYDSRRLSLNEGFDPLLMCCIDLSGIQNFIYDVASSKAYKSLKGRSFYLQLMLDQILGSLLSNLKQGPENIIYSSGGKAYFLLPNTRWVKEQLPPLLREIETFLWEEHKGKIFAAFGKVSFRYDFTPGGKEGRVNSQATGFGGKPIEELGSLWKAVSDAASIQKTRRFNQLLIEKYNDLFSENGKEALAAEKRKVCAVTGQPIIGDGADIGRKNNEVPVLSIVKEQTDLGTALKDCDYLIAYSGDEEESLDATRKKNNSGIYFPGLQRHAHLFKAVEEIEEDHHFRKVQSRPETAFLSINETRFLWSEKTGGSHASYGFLFYGGNKQPEIAENGSCRARTLEELCWINPDNEDEGYSKLGILRMDVDNLGQLFIHGFSERQKSFAAYGTLSLQLDLFFSGYLNTIRNSEKYKDHVAILYAGGDDVFAVGRWDKVLGFALEVRTRFQQFVGRPDISISAGLAIVDRKYPIYKAADIAGEAESMAKFFESQELGNKNAITFFGEAVSWNQEFEEVERLKMKMIHLCIEKNMSRSLLHQLQRYKAFRDDSERRHLEKGEPKDFSYKWHSAYYLKRFAERHKKQNEIVELLEQIQSRLLHDTVFGPDRFLSLAALAARWAEYELKMNKKR
ncbi:MAG: type III-A CRISPR-associated protein Cas10/Csm1 [Lewinellaceae bacterium]|nr:type III-A CRISPR-associated protein Cas10/Csm1 [Phaeodactylibacter sp.]MCB9041491.1 type III-A CRISPR-associated protein Cas10/Csm1 [Lewinellaceae bacterium]